jgi:hypothetical protein
MEKFNCRNNFYGLIGLLLCLSCNKAFLDTKPSSAIAQPSTLVDFQNLLENTNVINITGALQFLASDEYYFLDYASWQATYTATERQSYIWAKDIFGGETPIDDWNIPYQGVFYANNVLEGMAKLDPSVNNSQYNFLKGWAYFARAYQLYDITRSFAGMYDSATAAQDPGIPLKLKADVNDVEQRASMQSTYDQILSDVRQAAALLTNSLQSKNPNRPNKMSAYALAARIYLSAGNYVQAGLYADSCLQLYGTLIDFNSVDTNSTQPFPDGNAENLFMSNINTDYSALYSSSTTTSIDSNLIRSYDSNDLRMPVYFNQYAPGLYAIKSIYTNQFPSFSGLAVDEIYLIRAECFARAGLLSSALNDLNILLVNRYRTGTFIPVAAGSTAEALARILLERRKELVWRGLRWSDLKRLNKEGANITLTRSLNGQTYTLAPKDPRYIFNIPQDEINLSGITQNPR